MISACELSCDQLAVVSNLTTLINVRSGNTVINDFTTELYDKHVLYDVIITYAMCFVLLIFTTLT